MPQQQADLFDRAAECEMASQSAISAHERFALRRVRELWTSLANRSPCMTDAQVSEAIAAIEKRKAAELVSAADR
jgi:hypothetical protein